MLKNLLAVLVICSLFGSGSICLSEGDPGFENGYTESYLAEAEAKLQSEEGKAYQAELVEPIQDESSGSGSETATTDEEITESAGDRNTENGVDKEQDTTASEAPAVPEATEVPGKSSGSYSSREPAATPEPVNRTDDGLLKRGDRGNLVRQLQEKLNALGYDAGYVDGSFGPRTEAALLEYQKNHGLLETGTVNEVQFEALMGESINGEDGAIPGDSAQAPTIETQAAEQNNILRHAELPQIGESSFEAGVWRKASSGTGLREVLDIENPPVPGIEKGFHIANVSGEGKANEVAMDNVPVEYGASYIFSVYVKGEGVALLEAGNKPWKAHHFKVGGEWQRISLVIEMNEAVGVSQEKQSVNLYMGLSAGKDVSDIQLCGMQLEVAVPSAWGH